MKDTRVYVTRDKLNVPTDIEVWPAIVGIRKFHGCIQYGASLNCEYAVSFWKNERGRTGHAQVLTDDACKRRYGFIVEPGEAWYVAENGKRTKIDIAFSNEK